MMFVPFIPPDRPRQSSFLAEPDPVQQIGPQSWVLAGYALESVRAVHEAVCAVLLDSPLRKMPTPQGWMSVTQSNCGDYGWVADRTGYRYTDSDPLTGRPWPKMPLELYQLAVSAAKQVGFTEFDPQACLINHYLQGTRMGLHQDRDEADLKAPIVSVSLGLPAVFQFGGIRRTDPVQKVILQHGDVLVWGGVDRLRYHGVMTVKAAVGAPAHAHRLNLTFRRVT